MKGKTIKNKGITLIALVVTIVILMILAAVSMTMVLGDNGIFIQADKAKRETIIAEEKEAIGFAWQSLRIDRQVDYKTGSISDAELKNQLVADGEKEDNVEVTGGTGKLTINYKDSGNWYTIEQEGKIEYEEKDKIGKLSEVAKVGDFVNYNIEYTNTYNDYGELKDNIGTGWRVVYVDRENDIVKLIPEGIPLLESEENSIGDLVDNTVATEINLMELGDIEKACEQSIIEIANTSDQYGTKYEISNDLLDFILIGAYYRINTSGIGMYGRTYKMSVHKYGDISYQENVDEEDRNYGIRPVITLKAGIECKGGNGTKSNSFKIY